MKYLKSYNENIMQFLKPKSEKEILKSTKKLSKGEKFYQGISNGVLSLVKKAVEEGANPAIRSNFGLMVSSAHGYYDIVEYLLNDDRVNPSEGDNAAIKMASNRQHYDIVKLLLNVKRVRKFLSEQDIIKYTKETENINESIKDYLKPKSEEDIIKITKHLPPQEKFKLGIKNGILSLVKNGVENGANINVKIKDNDDEDDFYIPVRDWVLPIKMAKNRKYNDIVDYLNNLYKTNESIMDFLKPKSEEEIIKSIESSNMSDKDKFLNGCKHGLYGIVKKSMDDGFDPSFGFCRGLYFAAKNGHKNIVELLMSDDRVNSSKGGTEEGITGSVVGKHIYIGNYIRNNRKLKSNVTESIKDYLKPKSEEDIKKYLDGLTPDERLIKGCKHGIISVVKDAVKDGANVLINDELPTRLIRQNSDIDSIKILIFLLNHGAYLWVDADDMDYYLNSVCFIDMVLKEKGLVEGTKEYEDEYKEEVYINTKNYILYTIFDDFRNVSPKNFDELSNTMEFNCTNLKSSIRKYSIKIGDPIY